MKFAKIIFYVAFVWGIVILTPLYFMFDMIGRQDPPPITHPGFFYGFVGVALAWQIAFLIVAKDPSRYRLIMIPAVVEKFSFGLAVFLLVLQGRMHTSDLPVASIDVLLGILFAVSYLKTPNLPGKWNQGD